MIDLHCHLLPGIDDGPATMAEAVAMARAAWEQGTRTVVCTPHMHPSYPTRVERIHEGVAALREALAGAEVPLEVLPGAEISLEWLPRLGDARLAEATLGGGGWLLLEMPFAGWPLRLPEILRDLEMRGYRAVLAHPERADAVQRAPDRMRDLVGRGALVQLTAGSFAGEHGPAARRTAATLLASGMAHLLASDAHTAGPWRGPELEPGLLAAAEAAGVHAQALRWMVQDGPAAILAGGPVRPPRLTPGRRPPAAGRSGTAAPR